MCCRQHTGHLVEDVDEDGGGDGQRGGGDGDGHRPHRVLVGGLTADEVDGGQLPLRAEYRQPTDQHGAEAGEGLQDGEDEAEN